MTRNAVLARMMVELADVLVDDFDIVDLLSMLTTRCVEVLDIAAAGIMLVDSGGDLRLMSSSDEMMRIVEIFEIQAQEGPCVDCFRTGVPVVNRDLTTSCTGWPRFAPVAVDAGYRAADAIPMRLRGQVIGALNLFRVETGSLNDEDVATAQALADIATIAILQNRRSIELRDVNAQLSAALTSRIVIEQAKGIIAERQRLSIDEAFGRLRRYARNHQLRLDDVATSVVQGVLDLGDLIPAGNSSPG
jgi:GAF domain-containing protein